MENENQETTDNILNNSSPNLLLRDDSSEKDDIEEELETKIISRQIKATRTTAYEALRLTEQKDLNYDLIRFDMTFQSSEDKYFWRVYHTPKEVRKHIKKLVERISKNEILLLNNKPIDPVIIQIRHDNDVLNYLQNVTDFYLQLFEEPNLWVDPFFVNFFNIGGNSFLKQNAGIKPFEGWVEKKVDKHCCRKFFTCLCPFWELICFKRYNKRWIVLNIDNLFYLNDSMEKEGKIVYFFDKDMKVERDGKDCLTVKNSSMNLHLKFDTFFERELWREELEIRKHNMSMLSKFNRYEAYTTAKRYNLCQWFCDGKSYYDDLYEKIMAAEKCIYITDWWMSPEVFLKRPVDTKIYLDMKEKKIISKDLGDKMSRLMDILDYKARQGVKIYILIYYEVSIAVTLNSSHTLNMFKSLSPNIKVTRSPSGEGTLLWSHHEKLVVIDNIIGYVGGLDLCWGRFDFRSHPIYEAPNPEGIYYFPFIDYSNARICDFSEVQNYTKESVSRQDNLHMPWHDVHARIIGPAVADILRHFIERWNHANFADRKEKGITSMHQGSSFSQNKYNFWNKFSEILRKKGVAMEQKKSAEIMNNPLNKLESKETINIEQNKIGAEEDKKLQEEFLKGKRQIDEDHLFEKVDSKNIDENGEIKTSKRPAFYDKLVKSIAETGNRAMAINFEEQIANDELYKKYFETGSITSSVQVLRSSSGWSAGIKTTEKSILKAYYDLIQNAKHYIYIENQFFISKAWTEEEKSECPYSISDIVKNEIALYLRRRVEKAYMNKENFKIYVFLPLLPGFDGEPENSRTLQIIMKHTYASICRNYGLSIIESLRKVMGENWKNYIGFYSLRNHGLVNNVPRTEILYIHSKLMIIDDTKVLIGSANINDRSMLGKRDSEFAVIIKENKALINKKNNKNFIMNGKVYRAAHFATLFRKSLMAEHLGLDENDPILDDPVDCKLFNLIISRARNNTSIYSSLFKCYPDDAFLKYNDIKNAKKLKEKENPEVFLQNYLKYKDNIVGHIVEFPLLFLEGEALGRIYFTKENLVPEYNFT